MKLKAMTLRERIESVCLVSSLSLFLYLEFVDYRLVLFIFLVFAYLLDEKAKNAAQIKQLKETLEKTMAELEKKTEQDEVGML